MAATQDAINQLSLAIGEQQTVIAKNRSLLDRILTMFEQAADNPEEIRALVEQLRAGTQALSEDVARGTAAADEIEASGSQEPTA